MHQNQSEGENQAEQSERPGSPSGTEDDSHWLMSIIPTATSPNSEAQNKLQTHICHRVDENSTLSQSSPPWKGKLIRHGGVQTHQPEGHTKTLSHNRQDSLVWHFHFLCFLGCFFFFFLRRQMLFEEFSLIESFYWNDRHSQHSFTQYLNNVWRKKKGILYIHISYIYI